MWYAPLSLQKHSALLVFVFTRYRANAVGPSALTLWIHVSGTMSTNPTPRVEKIPKATLKFGKHIIMVLLTIMTARNASYPLQFPRKMS